jgi:hypothetical protein
MVAKAVNYFRQWSFMRILRLSMSIWLFNEAFYQQQLLLGLLGVLFAWQAIWNVGCCDSGTCAYTPKNPEPE